MADLFLHHAEPRAARGVPRVLDAVARGQELLREGHAHLGGRGAGVAEADFCWSDGEGCCGYWLLRTVSARCQILFDGTTV